MDDARLVIYRPPLALPVAPWANLATSTWYPVESTADGGLLRWMGAAGTLFHLDPLHRFGHDAREFHRRPTVRPDEQGSSRRPDV